jgi:hypothetical protein
MTGAIGLVGSKDRRRWGDHESSAGAAAPEQPTRCRLIGGHIGVFPEESSDASKSPEIDR